MRDIITEFLPAEVIRDVCILSNFIAAAMIGLWYAWATTQGASFQCKAAFTRLVHRWAMVIWSIILLYHGIVLMQEVDRVPVGASLLVNVGILALTVISGYRLHQAPDIPHEASWDRRIAIRADVMPSRKAAA